MPRGPAGPAGAPTGGGGEVPLDPALNRHLAATDLVVEARRAELEAAWRAGRTDVANAAVVAKEVGAGGTEL